MLFSADFFFKWSKKTAENFAFSTDFLFLFRPIFKIFLNYLTYLTYPNNNNTLKLLLIVGSAVVRRGRGAKIRRAPRDPSYFAKGVLMIRRVSYLCSFSEVHDLDNARSTVSPKLPPLRSCKFQWELPRSMFWIPKFEISNSNSTSRVSLQGLCIKLEWLHGQSCKLPQEIGVQTPSSKWHRQKQQKWMESYS